MNSSDINDPLFSEAVEAIDAGNMLFLEQLLYKHPELVYQRSAIPKEGYFKEPFLLWFIANNPIRHKNLPANIVGITKLIIQYMMREEHESLQYQLEYALGLVATGRIPKESGLQIELMNVLIDAGAKSGDGIGALAHANPAAAEHLIKRGGKLTLAAAVCLDWKDKIEDLLQKADEKERQLALVGAAFYGKKDMVSFLIQKGVDVNGYPDVSSGFHFHATALHQAVYSGSLDCVKLLVDAGASLDAKDKVYKGTPLGWAQHMRREVWDSIEKEKYKLIEDFLNSKAEG